MERRLAAIMLTDMVGYSRLMGLDEEGTISRQKAQPVSQNLASVAQTKDQHQVLILVLASR